MEKVMQALNEILIRLGNLEDQNSEIVDSLQEIREGLANISLPGRNYEIDLVED